MYIEDKIGVCIIILENFLVVSPYWNNFTQGAFHSLVEFLMIAGEKQLVTLLEFDIIARAANEIFFSDKEANQNHSVFIEGENFNLCVSNEENMTRNRPDDSKR